jgi:hypothetical protein
MALSQPRAIFGVHSWTAYSRTDGTFYGTAKVLGGSSLSLSGELVKLMGGSQKYPWAVEDGPISAEMTLKVKQYESFMFQLFLGNTPTDTGATASGTVSTLTNKNGSSIQSATTGIASVAVIPTTGAANLKFGKYVVKYASATTVDIFMSTDVDHSRGTNEEFDNDLLRVSTAQTITTGGANTDIASLGLRFTGGSGTIAFTSGDTATFEVLPPATKDMSVVIGATTDSFPEFGSLVYAQKRGNSEMFEIDAYRCKGVGLPIAFEENAWSEAEIKVECFYDSTLNGIMKIRHVTPSSVG